MKLYRELTEKEQEKAVFRNFQQIVMEKRIWAGENFFANEKSYLDLDWEVDENGEAFTTNKSAIFRIDDALDDWCSKEQGEIWLKLQKTKYFYNEIKEDLGLYPHIALEIDDGKAVRFEFHSHFLIKSKFAHYSNQKNAEDKIVEHLKKHKLNALSRKFKLTRMFNREGEDSYRKFQQRMIVTVNEILATKKDKFEFLEYYINDRMKETRKEIEKLVKDENIRQSIHQKLMASEHFQVDTANGYEWVEF